MFGCKNVLTLRNLHVPLGQIMHKSIPAVPSVPRPPPRATAGHLLTLSVPGEGHPQFYRGLGAGHLRTPGRSPGIRHACFGKCHWMSSSGKTGLEQLADVFKGMF